MPSRNPNRSWSVWNTAVCLLTYSHVIALRTAILRHQLVSNQVGHAPRRLVGDAKLPLKLLRGDAAARAGHQVHRVEPQVQGRGRLVEDRPGCGVEMVSAALTGPRLALLRGGIPAEFTGLLALRAFGVSPVLGIAIAPQPIKAGVVVGKLALEVHQCVIGFGRSGSDGVLAINVRHNQLDGRGRRKVLQ